MRQALRGVARLASLGRIPAGGLEKRVREEEKGRLSRIWICFPCFLIIVHDIET